MAYILFIKCILAGLLLAAPIGPVNLICIKRTLNEGRKAGLVVGLGAAAADAVYGYAAAAGLNFFISYIYEHETVFRWIGGLLIAYLGWLTYRSEPQIRAAEKETGKTLFGLFVGVFLLTLTNPVTIFTYIATFSALGIALLVTSLAKAAFAAFGVFLGSMLWWIILTSVISYLQDKITVKSIGYINKIAGVLIILIGIVSIVI